MLTKKKIRALILIATLIIIASAAVIIRIVQSKAESAERPALIAHMTTGKVVRGSISQVQSYTGNVYSIQQSSIYPKVSGNIEKIYADIGDYVRQDQLLALIDTTIYAQNVKQTNAIYNQTLANFLNAKLNYERNNSLLDQNLISKQDADNSRTAYEVAQSQRDAALAVYANSLTQLGYCRITAPFSGYITKRIFDAGSYVSSSAGSPGSILFILTDLDRLKAKVYIPEKDVPLLDQIKSIEVVADAFPEKVFRANLRKVSGLVDLATRTMEVEIDLENSGRLLKPGMFIKINLISDTKLNAMLLPDDVTQMDQRGNYVFIINQNITVSKRYVQLGLKQNHKTEVVSGIDDNDLLVFAGQNILKEGMLVKISK